MSTRALVAALAIGASLTVTACSNDEPAPSGPGSGPGSAESGVLTDVDNREIQEALSKGQPQGCRKDTMETMSKGRLTIGYVKDAGAPWFDPDQDRTINAVIPAIKP